jgi:hypothetical protein
VQTLAMTSSMFVTLGQGWAPARSILPFISILRKTRSSAPLESDPVSRFILRARSLWFTVPACTVRPAQADSAGDDEDESSDEEAENARFQELVNAAHDNMHHSPVMPCAQRTHCMRRAGTGRGHAPCILTWYTPHSRELVARLPRTQRTCGLTTCAWHARLTTQACAACAFRAARPHASRRNGPQKLDY